MSRLLYPFYRLSSLARQLLPSLSTVVLLAGFGLAMPQIAAAEAVPGPRSMQGPSGLPDGRVYEQVSPALKPGTEAGGPIIGHPPYIVAGADGNGVAYSKNGPLGEASSGLDYFSISLRSSGGWQSRAAISRGEGRQGIFNTNPEWGLGFSADMQASVFGAGDVFVPEQAESSPTPHLYRYDRDGLVQWLGQPTIAVPVASKGTSNPNRYGQLAGASPDFNTVYFGFQGALAQADEEPDPELGDISRAQEIRAANTAIEHKEPGGSGNEGFYEWHEGVLEAAGVLPNGRLDPYGAAAAATLRVTEPEDLDNQVSEDGRVAFFVSPDPGSSSGRPSELYMRKTAVDGTQATTLVSRDLVLAEIDGEPAAARSGVVEGLVGSGSDVYASPDGSHAFFSSKSQLTAEAPDDNTLKAYEFDTETHTLSYVPGLSSASQILRSSRTGSNLLFVQNSEELALWNEGTVTDIAPIEAGFSGSSGLIVRAAPTGSTYVFQAKSAFPNLGFNDGEGRYTEVYRYETAGNTLSCISCPPVGTSPTGNATLSHAFGSGGLGNTLEVITGNHGISEDGSRVAFDTPDALVSQDTNGVRDAYEWENGTVYLISSGVSQEQSFSGDISTSGNDIFFSTGEGIAAGDTDAGYDVYDARVPRPGDQLPPSAVPCEGAVCQGPPSVPQLLSSPASEMFDGIGNVTSPPSNHSASRSLTRAQKLARALKQCKHQEKASKRQKCIRQARKRYGGKAAKAQQHGRMDLQHNRRGK